MERTAGANPLEKHDRIAGGGLFGMAGHSQCGMGQIFGNDYGSQSSVMARLSSFLHGG